MSGVDEVDLDLCEYENKIIPFIKRNNIWQIDDLEDFLKDQFINNVFIDFIFSDELTDEEYFEFLCLRIKIRGHEMSIFKHILYSKMYHKIEFKNKYKIPLFDGNCDYSIDFKSCGTITKKVQGINLNYNIYQISGFLIIRNYLYITWKNQFCFDNDYYFLNVTCMWRKKMNNISKVIFYNDNSEILISSEKYKHFTSNSLVDAIVIYFNDDLSHGSVTNIGLEYDTKYSIKIIFDDDKFICSKDNNIWLACDVPAVIKREKKMNYYLTK
jgi:hypothetical protein